MNGMSKSVPLYAAYLLALIRVASSMNPYLSIIRLKLILFSDVYHNIPDSIGWVELSSAKNLK
jgi:hypothetical protein